jgi:ABC-2 type transport system ATP-binding protein
MQSKSMDLAIKVVNLRKAFGETIAVDGLSFDVRQREVFGFLGPNGAGKTTTILVLCGLLEADSGEVLIDGIPLSEDHRRGGRKLGYCPQEIVIWDDLTCLEQMEFMGQQYSVSWSQSRKRARDLLGILGLEKKSGALAGTLSGGMKRRLNIGLALMHDPEILILDEPQAGLDPQSRILVREYLDFLSQDRTVILTTHDMEEADRMAKRVGIIDHGKLLVLDTPGNLKEGIGEGDVLEIKVSATGHGWKDTVLEAVSQEVENVGFAEGSVQLVCRDAVNLIPALVAKLQKTGVGPEGVSVRGKTLEDVFISLTGRGLRE